MSHSFHKLNVTGINKPIEDATTITFDLPISLQKSFSYYPGQHLIIKFLVNGQEARRSYSLNSCPFKDEALQVTVKRVKGGLVSNYVNDHLKVGEELAVMIPQGRFYADIHKDAYKTYFLFAAGSGVTPILSILQSVLIASPNSRVNLFYGNTHQDSILFEAELDELKAQYPERFQLVHTLSDPKVWSTWKQWEGRKGRIDATAVEWFITNYPPIAQNTEYYICGPGAMNISVRDTLMGLQIPKELIHIEQFGGTTEAPNTNIKAVDAQLSVTLNQQTTQHAIPKDKTILQVLKAANIPVPYSCESGVCGTCVAKVKTGKVAMKACMALEDKDIEKGLVLTCQAVATTEKVAIVFEG